MRQGGRGYLRRLGVESFEDFADIFASEEEIHAGQAWLRDGYT